MDQVCTVLFPKEEKVGYRFNNHLIIFSATSISITNNLIFPFPILFYSLPFDESFILVVSSDDPKKLILWDFNTKEIQTCINFDYEIVNFLYSGAFSCVITYNGAAIVRSRPLVIHHTIETKTPLTAFSLIVSPNDDNHCLFAYGNDSVETSVTVVTIPSSSRPVTFQAHKSAIRAVALSNNAKYIATVSNKGTIIRLWSLDGKLITENRRGMTPATIIHMSFSPCSNFLCVSSNHFTSHIFKIEASHSQGSNFGIISKYYKTLTGSDPSSWLGLLPKADITVSIQDAKSYSSFVFEGGKVLCAVTEKGACEMYDIDLENNKSSLKSKVIIPKFANAAI